ncbi:MAG: hypothetical protein HYW45_01400 [Candidatus Daviesbacteria bacterium]|nr:MAG: hypothetical protein HYW45_01400 [Candidatus Daviesbacteria bacterium]
MSSSKESGFVHLLVLVVGLSGALFVSSLIPVNRHYNNGKSDVSGVSLAKGGDDSVKVETKEVKETSRAETKTTPEKIKSEIREGNLRIKFEVKNDKVKIETKVKEAEKEVELEDEAEDEAIEEMENELEREDINIATAPGQIALVHKRVGALLNFPLSVDPTTRQLTVTTPAGSKVVAVLPQQAIDNMLAAKIMDDVVSEKVENNLGSVPSLVKLETENGVLGYKVKGTKTHKLLGLIPVKTPVEVFVSAENGQVVESTESLLGKILSRLIP